MQYPLRFMFCCLFILTMITTNLFAADSKIENDVRNVRWGMSKKEVIKNEEFELDSNFKNDMLFSKNLINFFGLEFRLAYKFENGELSSVIYVYQGNIDIKSIYENQFQEILLILYKKYGKPLLVNDHSVIFGNKRTNASIFLEGNKNNSERPTTFSIMYTPKFSSIEKNF